MAMPLQSAAVATGNGNPINCTNSSTLSLQASGTFVGTVTVEGTVDGTNWVALPVSVLGSSTATSTITAPGIYQGDCAGMLMARARISAYTSGSITIIGDAVSGEAGGLGLTGNIASGVTDAGNPIKTGGVYNSSPPTLTSGQRGDTQMDASANTKVSLGTLIEGEDATLHRMKTAPSYSFNNITTAATTTVKSGAGVIGSIQFNKRVASGVVTVYDNTAGSGTKIGTITAPATLLSDPPSAPFMQGIAFSTGLTLVTSAADDITVSYL